MKRLLMVAFHFPPFAGSSGIQRTLRFVQHLPAFGWEPIVLTADPRAYERTSEDLSAEVPAGTVVERAFALDTARHLSFKGRYPGFLARPDRWITWALAAVPAGLKLARRYSPHAMWSTYPIASAHAVGRAIALRSGLPWIADFRDPMAQEGYPADAKVWRSFKNIEEWTIRESAASVFTTPGAARMYRDRYPDAASRMHIVENGYDEPTFAAVEEDRTSDPLTPGAVTLLHSGVVYPWERDPSCLLRALRRLADQTAVATLDIEAKGLPLVFRDYRYSKATAKPRILVSCIVGAELRHG